MIPTEQEIIRNETIHAHHTKLVDLSWFFVLLRANSWTV